MSYNLSRVYLMLSDISCNRPVGLNGPITVYLTLSKAQVYPCGIIGKALAMGKKLFAEN